MLLGNNTQSVRYLKRYLVACGLCLCVFGLSSPLWANSSSRTVTLFAESDSYVAQVVEEALVLGASSVNFDAQHVVHPGLSLDRRVRLLEQNDGFDIVALAVTKERMDKLTAIQQPLQFGLQGLRILLVTKASSSRVSQIRNVSDLARLHGGFVYGWADMGVLNANKLPIHYAANKQRAYEMLASQRVDYFPRSTAEVLVNYRQQAALYPNLAIEPNIALYYPLPMYLFVRNEDTVLADTLRVGMAKLHESGRLRQLFIHHFGDAIATLDLDNRHIIELDNPDLPQGLVLPELVFLLREWHQPIN